MSLPKIEGLYNPALRFAFTNITESDFTSAWDGQPIVVKPHQTIELTHHLAVKLTNELVDKIMTANFKKEEVEKNQAYYRHPQGMMLGVPAARKVWEDQIVRELAVDEESPQLQVIRAQIRQEIKADYEKAQEPAGSVQDIKIDPTEFAELKKEVKKVPKKSLKTKVIKNEATHATI